MSDLAGLLSPPPGTQVHFGQGVVESWDATELRNTISWKGARIHDLPTVSGLSAMTIDRGDSVALLGWETPNGVSTWWVTGRVVPPGEEASHLTVRGGNLGVGSGGTLFALYESGREAVKFGPLRSVATNELTGHGLLLQIDGPTNDTQPDIFKAIYDSDGYREVVIGENSSEGRVDNFLSWALRSHHYAYESMKFQTLDDSSIEILSDEMLWLYGDDEVLISSPNGDVQALATGGQGRFGGTSGTFLAPEAGSGSANMRIDTSSGRITYVTGSSERIKRDIQDLAVDPDAVLQIRPRSWLPGPVEQHCPDWVHAQHADEECHAGAVIEPPEGVGRDIGLVAEELDAVGLGDFVEYDEEDRPSAIRYDRLAVALVPVVQRQQAQIDELTARLNALEGS